MIANATLDTVVTMAWVGALAVVLLAQAFLAWLAHRHATRSAREAARLARATAPRERPAADRAAPARRHAARLRVVSSGDRIAR